jgi:hypothetical protein
MKKPYDLSDCNDLIRLAKESEMEAFNVCEENGGNMVPEEWEFEMVGPNFSILKVRVKKIKNGYKVFINDILYAIIYKNRVKKINSLEKFLEKSS